MANKPIIDGGDAPVKTVSSTPPRSIPPTTSTTTPPPSPLPSRAPTNPPPIAPIITNPPQQPPGAAPLVPTALPVPIDPPPPPLSGGGAPGTPVITHNNTGDTGGLGANAAQWFLMLPVLIPFNPTTTKQHVIAIYDTTDFNDQLDVTYYQYRAEDIVLDRQPTVRRVVIQYRDLGVVTIGLFLEGTNDNNQVVRASREATIGNGVPTRRILTALIDISLTAFRPQLTIVRPSYGGPLSIIQVTLIGTVEDSTL